MASLIQQQYNELPEDVSRILFVTFPNNLNQDLLYQFFGQFGPLQSLRLNPNYDMNANSLRNGFVIYQDVLDAYNTFTQLNSQINSFITVRYFKAAPITG